MARDNDIILFIEQSERDQIKLIGKLSRWYRNGCDDSTLTPTEIKFLSIINEAHAMMIDVANLNNRTAIAKKIMTLHGMKSVGQVYFILEIADALYNSTKASDKRYQKQMMNTFLLDQLAKSDKEGDHKAKAKYAELYINLNKLDQPLTDEDNPIIETIIHLEANPALLKNYDAENAEKNKERVSRLEIKAKTLLHGQ